ncbi:MAG TPA: histidine kinase, partial [Chitinophagaceae bacterium]|nr:histidine kinase [Chitinophagaceae bacterium]
NWLTEKIEPGDDLKNADLLFARFAITPDGNMWVNSFDRVLLWQGKKNIAAQVIPEIVIEEIQLYNKSTDWSVIADSISGYRQFPVFPVLKYSQNSFSVSFNAIQFARDAVTEFQYQLEPIDEQWSHPITNNTVSFYQLSPGTYHFRVRARLRGSGWGEPAEFSFRIEKPFWETWWFRILILVLASSLLITIYRSRINQWRRKTAMETQIHELEMNALKAQMNPHFIYNALNSIQSLIINDRPKEASGYISKFAKLLRQVLENAEKDLIPLSKELYSLQLYVDLEKLRMNMEVDYVVSMDAMVQPDQTRVPPLILQPFVENALWHGLSRKQGDKKISLRLITEKDWILCEITDNGIGRKNAVDSYSQFPEGHLSKAVHITRQRLMDFNQSPGTEPLTFIDNEERGQASGTTVVIRISNRASF